jgi:hypothetical protein
MDFGTTNWGMAVYDKEDNRFEKKKRWGGYAGTFKSRTCRMVSAERG